MKINAINIRQGNVLEHNDKLWVVLKSDIMQPGKGASVVQVEMRDIANGNKTNVRFRTQETVEKAHVEGVEHQFLFADGDNFTFMNTRSYEQVVIDRELIGDPAVYLQDGMVCNVAMHESGPLNVELPAQATFEVVEADAVVKGQTASSSYKPGVLENGARVLIPPHIEAGTRVVVKTEDGSYVERAKD